MREAGEQTTWTAPNTGFEAQVHAAVDAAYDDSRVQRVVHTMAARLAGPGWSNALSAKLVALTMPGVPDVYQGSELWEQSLVDPDNRRPVDFEHRAEVLAGGASPDLVSTIDDPGHAKLLVTREALLLRRDRPELFTTYLPLAAEGSAADHLLAFDRGGAITLATRLPVGLAARGGWSDTTIELPGGPWRDVISGRSLSGPTIVPADLLGDQPGRLPVALLIREDS